VMRGSHRVKGTPPATHPQAEPLPLWLTHTRCCVLPPTDTQSRLLCSTVGCHSVPLGVSLPVALQTSAALYEKVKAQMGGTAEQPMEEDFLAVGEMGEATHVQHEAGEFTAYRIHSSGGGQSTLSVPSCPKPGPHPGFWTLPQFEALYVLLHQWCRLKGQIANSTVSFYHCPCCAGEASNVSQSWFGAGGIFRAVRGSLPR